MAQVILIICAYEFRITGFYLSYNLAFCIFYYLNVSQGFFFQLLLIVKICLSVSTDQILLKITTRFTVLVMLNPFIYTCANVDKCQRFINNNACSWYRLFTFDDAHQGQ